MLVKNSTTEILRRRAEGLRRLVVDSPTPLTERERDVGSEGLVRTADEVLAASENLLRRAQLPTSHRPS